MTIKPGLLTCGAAAAAELKACTILPYRCDIVSSTAQAEDIIPGQPWASCPAGMCQSLGRPAGRPPSCQQGGPPGTAPSAAGLATVSSGPASLPGRPLLPWGPGALRLHLMIAHSCESSSKAKNPPIVTSAPGSDLQHILHGWRLSRLSLAAQFGNCHWQPTLRRYEHSRLSEKSPAGGG